MIPFNLAVNSLYKLITTIGFIGAIYCFSIPMIKTDEYNIGMIELGFRRIEYNAISLKLEKQIDDLIKKIGEEKIDKGSLGGIKFDTILSHHDYYVPNYLFEDGQYVIDSLNLLCNQYFEYNTKIIFIKVIEDTFLTNYRQRDIFLFILGVVSFIIFLVGTFLWYHKSQKYEDNEIVKHFTDKNVTKHHHSKYLLKSKKRVY